MSKKSRKKAPKHFQQTREHCNIEKVVDAMWFSIQDNWMNESELDAVYKKLKKKFAERKRNGLSS